MERSWTFNQKISLGFAAMVAIVLVLAVLAVTNLRSVVREKDRVITVNVQLQTLGEKLIASNQARMADLRGYVIAREPELLEQMRLDQESADKVLERVRDLSQTPDERDLAGQVESTNQALKTAHAALLSTMKEGLKGDALSNYFKDQVVPRANGLESAVGSLIKKEEALSDEAKQNSNDAARDAINLLIGFSLAGVALAIVLAIVLSRALGRQIGSAVQHIQSSSGELQAAASQQTSGTREQVTSMSEISTTIKELLATSRQIAESSQRVSEIAENTASAAKKGDLTVQGAQDGIQTIKKQVDVIVAHMLELGKKSQQAGGILEIINELAEQTNILAINATIEATGAGEAGRRFVVVADEIRKLADRVGGSTKDIRALIEEIRSAVNTTIMATETGAKAVDSGTRQFSDLNAAFREIVGMVATSRDAAREIELSTKQQSSSVEQVSAAISTIAQTAKESEASSTQTLQTVSELTNLSRALAQLVQSRA